MKMTALFAAALAMTAAAATAQTDSSNTKSGVKTRPGAMTINQASGGGKPHAPRTGNQPTKRAPHASAGIANRAYGAGAHATTSRGIKQTGIRKGPTRPAKQ